MACPLKIIKILIAVTDEMVRRTLSEYLNALPVFEVVGEAGNGLEAVKEVSRLSPDVVLIESQMPIMNGLEATRQIKQNDARVTVIVLYDLDGPVSELGILNYGSDFSVSKWTPPGELVADILRVHKSSTKRRSLANSSLKKLVPSSRN